jgi:hypothetical protein
VLYFIKTGGKKMKRKKEDRKTILLKACYDILKKSQENGYVEDVMTLKVRYDNVWCDGMCLLEDIGIELEID